MNQTVKTIISQIEKGVLMALGARQFVYGENHLQFKANRRDKVVIIYDNTWDTYTVQLWTGNLLNLRKLEEYEGVHVEILNGILLSLDR